MLDFRPDLAEDTPGLITDVSDLMPTERGYKGWHYPVQQTAHSLTLSATYANESPISSLFATRCSSQAGGIVIAGTNRDLYVYDFANGFGSVGIAGGYSTTGQVFNYGEDANAAFDICAFGDIVIATHRTTLPQYRVSTTLNTATKFANLGTTHAAPKASVCEVAQNFVFLGDIASTWGSTTTVVGQSNMVAWSSIGDHQNWDVNPQVTQGSYAVFNDTPGPITALKRLNDGIVVFKANSMYFGRYVGTGVNSTVWDFQRISDRIGCLGHRSVTDVGNRLVFVGPEDAYIFDGSYPRSITQGIYQTEFKGQTNFGGVWPMWVGHDKVNGCVMFRRSNNPGFWLIWSYLYNKWSLLRNHGNGGALTGTNGAGDGIEIFCKTNTNDLRTTTTTQYSGTISTDHYDLYTLFATGSASSGGFTSQCKCYNRFNANSAWSNLASLRTGAIGHDEKVSLLRRVTPKFAINPAVATLTVDRKDNLGANWTAGSTTFSMDARKRFDLLTGVAAAPWQRVTLTMTTQSGAEVTDIGYTIVAAGNR